MKSQPNPEWNRTALEAHVVAYEKAKADFLRDMEHEPETVEELSSILRRAEGIRKGEISEASK